MEMKTIPNYPNYAATTDGRIYSYFKKGFLSPHKASRNAIVILSFDGVKFCKTVSQLIFKTFNNRTVEGVSHIDGDKYNNNLENLREISKKELSEIAVKAKIQKIKKRKIYQDKNIPIYRVDIVTHELSIIKRSNCDEKEFQEIQRSATNSYRRIISHRGGLFFYDGEKEELVKEIKARIQSNKLLLISMDRYNPFISMVKSHIKKQQKYLEILEKI